MVHQKNYEDPVGGEKNRSGSVADGWHNEGADDHSEKKTTWVSGACIEERLHFSCGMIKGKRAGGRQRMKYMDGIKEMVRKEKMEEVVKLASNRRLWHSIVANVT